MATVHDLRVDSIIIEERLRPLSDPAVAELIESFKRIGQIQPITVYRPKGIPRLVTGHHRLVAARSLGLETISCVILPDSTSDDDCLQIEIAENLHRSDLTKDERDRHIRLLAEIIAKKDADKIQVSQNAAPEIGYKKPPPQTKGVVGKIADQTGLSKDTVRRALNPEAEAEKRAAKDAARAEREAQQAEHDRQRAEVQANLPASIQAAEAAKEANRLKASQRGVEADQDDDLTAQDRIAALEETVRVLEADNAALKAENALYGDMKAAWDRGGFEAVIASKDEALRVAGERIRSENHDKTDWKRQADYWKGQALKLGWKSGDIKIDTKTGVMRDA